MRLGKGSAIYAWQRVSTFELAETDSYNGRSMSRPISSNIAAMHNANWCRVTGQLSIPMSQSLYKGHITCLNSSPAIILVMQFCPRIEYIHDKHSYKHTCEIFDRPKSRTFRTPLYSFEEPLNMTGKYTCFAQRASIERKNKVFAIKAEIHT